MVLKCVPLPGSIARWRADEESGLSLLLNARTRRLAGRPVVLCNGTVCRSTVWRVESGAAARASEGESPNPTGRSRRTNSGPPAASPAGGGLSTRLAASHAGVALSTAAGSRL